MDGGAAQRDGPEESEHEIAHDAIVVEPLPVLCVRVLRVVCCVMCVRGRVVCLAAKRMVGRYRLE